ncbi:MAG TPA: HAD-IIB family hydrolase, partial [Limnochordia bacterium]
GGSTKALIVAAPEAVEAWVPRLSARFAGRLQIARSKAHYIEVTAPGIDKGRALAALAERMAVPPAQVMAIGDGWNDLGMIEFAGFGIAMGNAPAGVRARAAAVTGTNEEAGVAQAIERWVLSGAAGSG